MSKWRIAWLAVFFIVLIWSGIDPKDFTTWVLEVMPALIAIALLTYTRDSFPLTTLTYTLILIHVVILLVGGHYTYAEVPIGDLFRDLFDGTRNSFPLTTLTYTLILIHCVILMVGGHYTYAEVPIGDWFRELFDGSRNNYDKLGHFAQGFVPAIVAREIVIRLSVFNSNAWMNFFIVAMCLGISAFYELIEWWVALMSGEAADAFLGTQGYIWDTQSDMELALAGAIIALVLLGKVHDSQLNKQLSDWSPGSLV